MGMDLRHFPFDAQNLKVILRPQRSTKDDVILKYLSEESAMDSLPEHEWKFYGFTSKRYHTDPKMSSANKVYSCLHIIVFARRVLLVCEQCHDLVICACFSNVCNLCNRGRSNGTDNVSSTCFD